MRARPCARLGRIDRSKSPENALVGGVTGGSVSHTASRSDAAQ